MLLKILIKHFGRALDNCTECQTEKVPSLVKGGGETVGVRMPIIQLFLRLLKQLAFRY